MTRPWWRRFEVSIWPKWNELLVDRKTCSRG